MIDRSFGSIYFLPCSNSLLGIATSHIGLIRSLYCSVFKEPSLFKRLDYLTTFVEVCQMIFFQIFFIALSNGAASSATGIILPHCLSCVNCFFHVFLIWALSWCVIMVGMAQRFPRFPNSGFPLFRFPYTVCLTTYEKNFSLRSK